VPGPQGLGDVPVTLPDRDDPGDPDGGVADEPAAGDRSVPLPADDVDPDDDEPDDVG